MFKIRARKQSETDEERPKIYVTYRGARYVKADELLRSKRARAQIEAMAKIDFNRSSTSAPSKEPSQETCIIIP